MCQNKGHFVGAFIGSFLGALTALMLKTSYSKKVRDEFLKKVNLQDLVGKKHPKRKR